MNLPRTKEGKIDIKEILIQSGLYLVLLAILLAIIIKEPSFLSIRNFQNILTQSSVKVIIALGVAGLIVTTGTDLSAGGKLDLRQLSLRLYCKPQLMSIKYSPN